MQLISLQFKLYNKSVMLRNINVSLHKLTNIRYCLAELTIYMFNFKMVLQDAVFLATCLATLEREVHCKLQKKVYTLQSRAATCSGFNKSMKSFQEVGPSSAWCDRCKTIPKEGICDTSSKENCIV